VTSERVEGPRQKPSDHVTSISIYTHAVNFLGEYIYIKKKSTEAIPDVFKEIGLAVKGETHITQNETIT